MVPGIIRRSPDSSYKGAEIWCTITAKIPPKVLCRPIALAYSDGVLYPGTPEHGGEGVQLPLPWKKGARGAEVPLLFCLVIKIFSQFLFTFVLLSSLLENDELLKVSGRQSNEVLEHLPSAFSDGVL